MGKVYVKKRGDFGIIEIDKDCLPPRAIEIFDIIQSTGVFENVSPYLEWNYKPVGKDYKNYEIEAIWPSNHGFIKTSAKGLLKIGVMYRAAVNRDEIESQSKVKTFDEHQEWQVARYSPVDISRFLKAIKERDLWNTFISFHLSRISKTSEIQEKGQAMGVVSAEEGVGFVYVYNKKSKKMNVAGFYHGWPYLSVRYRLPGNEDKPAPLRELRVFPYVKHPITNKLTRELRDYDKIVDKAFHGLVVLTRDELRNFSLDDLVQGFLANMAHDLNYFIEN